MKKKLSYLFLILVILSGAVTSGITITSCKSNKLKTKNITIYKADSTTINVKAELAITPDERSHGFMERKNIPDGTGMIFIFEKDQILSFWMKTPLTRFQLPL